MDKKEIAKRFISPDNEYRGKPFWSWNGELKEKELIRQTKIMKEMGLGGYFMHSRAGLITEYLGEEWFDLINAVADAAEKDGMEAWLYDEDRWPSGSAGGKVTVDAQYRMKSLYVFQSAPEKYKKRDNTIAVYIAKTDGISIYTKKEIDLSEEITVDKLNEEIASLSLSAQDDKGEWQVLVFAIVPDAPSSNYNGTTYIDTMSRKAVDRFILLTHEEYKKHCGDRLGRSIKGIFTDEPHRGLCFDNLTQADGVIACGVCWTDDIFEEFEKRYGYDAKALLPELFYRSQGEKVAPVKLHYIDLANNLFLERFAMPINEWCNNNNIIFTGHVLHEDSLMNQTVPNGSLMRFYEHMGYPGVDCLTENNRCYWIVKQIASSARQLNKKWLLSELYGCTGWKFNFRSHKAVGDWQALFGINLRCQHLSWYTMEGESKRDYPASILHQSPWYKQYSFVEDYFARFGLVMSEGTPDCDVLLLNPIESLWCQAYLGWAKWIRNASPDVQPYEERYARTFHMLTDNQIDFDYGEEEMMRRLASVEIVNNEAVLKVGNASYKTVIVTNMLTIRPSTLDILEEFMNKGGKVIFSGTLPEYEDARPSLRPEALSKNANAVCIEFNEEALVDAVRGVTSAYVSVVDADGLTEKCVFAQVRKHFGGEGYAAVMLNTDRNNARGGLKLKLKADNVKQVQLWVLESGERLDVTHLSTVENGIVTVDFDIEAAGTVCFVFTNLPEPLEKKRAFNTVSQALLEGEFDYSLNESNVCVLDFVKWQFNDEWHEAEEVLKADRHLRELVNIEHRGGQMLQPWFAKLNYREVYGTLRLSYEFFIDEMPKGDVYLAGERPLLNNYAVNGVRLTDWSDDEFWIDDCFKKTVIPDGVLKQGRNEVTAEVSFMRTTNLEAVYLLGDFGVRLEGSKRILTSLPHKLSTDNLEKYMLPFYTGAVTYHVTPIKYKAILGDSIKDGDRILLVTSFVGGCAVVSSLNSSSVLGWDPYEADVTQAVKNGEAIDVTVVGTRRNVFGPLHEANKDPAACGPGNFVTTGASFTEEYSLIDSGIKGIAFKIQKSSRS